MKFLKGLVECRAGVKTRFFSQRFNCIMRILRVFGERDKIFDSLLIDQLTKTHLVTLNDLFIQLIKFLDAILLAKMINRCLRIQEVRILKKGT